MYSSLGDIPGHSTQSNCSRCNSEHQHNQLFLISPGTLLDADLWHNCKLHCEKWTKQYWQHWLFRNHDRFHCSTADIHLPSDLRVAYTISGICHLAIGYVPLRDWLNLANPWQDRGCAISQEHKPAVENPEHSKRTVPGHRAGSLNSFGSTYWWLSQAPWMAKCVFWGLRWLCQVCCNYKVVKWRTTTGGFGWGSSSHSCSSRCASRWFAINLKKSHLIIKGLGNSQDEK